MADPCRTKRCLDRTLRPDGCERAKRSPGRHGEGGACSANYGVDDGDYPRRPRRPRPRPRLEVRL